MNRTREETIQIFIRSIRRYFARFGEASLEVLTPYLLEAEPVLLDFTAIIGISGEQKGFCYFTAENALLAQLGLKMGEPVLTPALFCDLAGEVANTLSGNARLDLGPGFMISVPVNFEGRPKSLHLSSQMTVVAIPLRWNKNQAQLIVALENFGSDHLP